MWSILRRALNTTPAESNTESPTNKDKFSRQLARNERLIRSRFSICDDLEYRQIKIPALGNRKALIIFVDGLINDDILNRDVIAPLMSTEISRSRCVQDLLTAGKSSKYRYLDEVEAKLFLGSILVLADGDAEAVLIQAQDWPMRSIEEPVQERAIRGPRDGFTETAKVNLGLVRRRLPNSSLKVENISVGRRSSTAVHLLYIADVADKDVVDELRERINAIDIDGLLESGALGELINERTITPFPLFLSTERPDKVVAGLLEGKVAVISDGSPFAMLTPVVFADFYQVAEDYYTHPIFATISRAYRFASLFVASSVTAIYTATIAFHYEIIPRDIIVFVAQTREGVPFSPFAEAFAIELLVELIREASIRLPGPIGPTIGIVGALVLGQAAVDARLVSPVLLIVVAISLMANFNIPNYEAALSVRFLRFLILGAAVFL